ncbi:MAG: hypothetical protein ACK5XO_14310 [Phycisphaerales bacterium]
MASTAPLVPQNPPSTVVHVTHEAIDHLGGIGTVLAGLITAPAYVRSVKRTILVGPLPWPDRHTSNPISRLGEFARELHYSGVDNVDPIGLGAILRPIEWAFGTRMVVGTRVFESPGHEPATAQVLLVDVSHPNRERLAAFKWLLYEKFGLDSQRYESNWDYEEYVRLADPTYHALAALLNQSAPGRAPGAASAASAASAAAAAPAMVIAHEFMGIPTALRCSLDRARFRTAFHAHECSTARRIVENVPGHDVSFYPAMRNAMKLGLHVEDVFGHQADFARHALVSRSHRLDTVLAVGPETRDELLFLSPAMQAARPRVRVAYNGLPAPKMKYEDRLHARALVNQWLGRVMGFVPDVLITHVTRPVPSKGLWRDRKVMLHLESLLRARKLRAAYVLLTCGAPIRTREQVEHMARTRHWPLHHQEGYPDLAGPESGVYRSMLSASAHAHEQASRRGTDSELAITPILVNQFGFSRERLGEAAPQDMTLNHLRAAADAEMGLSIYEPFGIAPLEPLHAGAVCVVSSVSGCMGLVRRAIADLNMDLRTCPLVLEADFVADSVLAEAGLMSAGDRPSVDQNGQFRCRAIQFGAHERDMLEERVCARLATELAARLPSDESGRRAAFDLGQRLADRMSWDAVATSDFIPGLASAMV